MAFSVFFKSSQHTVKDERLVMTSKVVLGLEKYCKCGVLRSYFEMSLIYFRSIQEEREPSYKSEEQDEFHLSSTESLHELQVNIMLIM